VTPYEIPETTCPFCGTQKATNPAYSDLFHEQKDMVQYGGFPSYVACADVDEPLVPVAEEQCPPAVNNATFADQPESCQLGCSGDGVCHSHNVFGECIHVVEWDLAPKVGDANVQELIIFQGDAVQFKYTGNGNAHNLFLMRDSAALDACDFDDAGELANVAEIQVGHVYPFDEAGTYHFSCGIGCTGFGEGGGTGGNQTLPVDEPADMMMERDEALCHCNVGQKLTVEVKDASQGLQCHDHSYTGAAEASSSANDTTVASRVPCGDGQVSVIAIDNVAYMAQGPTQCAEFCTPSFALTFMTDVETGSCADQGFVYSPVRHSVSLPNSPVPIEVLVTDRQPDTAANTTTTATGNNCHCHSYEKIACPEAETANDTSYDEHIAEIETHCQGIVAGEVEVCPYLCFQPMEVLHLHYIECPSRPVDPTYLAVNATDLCHKAAPAPTNRSDSCPIVTLARPTGSIVPMPTSKRNGTASPVRAATVSPIFANMPTIPIAFLGRPSGVVAPPPPPSPATNPRPLAPIVNVPTIPIAWLPPTTTGNAQDALASDSQRRQNWNSIMTAAAAVAVILLAGG
jgi:hypothetical protein